MKLITLSPVFFLVAAHAGCANDPALSETPETDEIVDNLIRSGYPVEEIQVADGVVYVGGDGEVSLEASREMLEVDDPDGPVKEQYRTHNLVSRSMNEICIYDGNLAGRSGRWSIGLDAAIQNYNQLGLTFHLVRISKPSTDNTHCDSLITVKFNKTDGGISGFPSGGHPFSTVTVGTGLLAHSNNVIEWVFTHELGHTLGLRHSDYYNRAISCGAGTPSPNEGKEPAGAILVPGTPAHAKAGGSIMNSCFRTTETGELTASDKTTLRTLY